MVFTRPGSEAGALGQTAVASQGTTSIYWNSSQPIVVSQNIYDPRLTAHTVYRISRMLKLSDPSQVEYERKEIPREAK
jgi:hypothetical protein